MDIMLQSEGAQAASKRKILGLRMDKDGYTTHSYPLVRTYIVRISARCEIKYQMEMI